MTSPRIVFVPVARTTFDMESAEASLHASQAMVRRLGSDILMPEHHLTDYDAMKNWLSAQMPYDAVIFQASTFVDPRFALEFCRFAKVPTLVWGLREPSAGGGRLRLNSMTGVFALTNVLSEEDVPFRMVVGNPGEEKLEKDMARWIHTAGVMSRLRSMRLGVIGSIPPGYFFSLEEETMLRRHVGPTVVQTEIYKLFKKAEACTREERLAVLRACSARLSGLDTLPEARAMNFAGLYKAVADFIEENSLDALCGRCWPDTFEAMDMAPCGLYSLFADALPVACEADMGGAVTNAALKWISHGGTAYFADPVQVEEDKNTITFWHCGFGAPSLASSLPVPMGTHPNRKVGPTMEFAVRPGRVTMCRIGKHKGQYRMLIAGGEALDEPRRFQGTSAIVRPDCGAEAFASALARQGWEYHISFVHGDVSEELELLAEMLGMEAVRL